MTFGTQKPTFGASTFGGNTTAASTFGGGSTSTFGTMSTGGTFGSQQPTATPFGAASTTGTFGSAKPAASMFGSTVTATSPLGGGLRTGTMNTFGATSTFPTASTTATTPFKPLGTTATGFGTPNTTTTGGLFGTSMGGGTLGSTAKPTSSWGVAKPAGMTGMGSLGGGLGTGGLGSFGSTQQGAATGGTLSTKFTPVPVKDDGKAPGGKMNKLQFINAHPQFADKSFEELRWDDTLLMKQSGGVFASAKPLGAFGASSPAPQQQAIGGTNMFGQPVAASPFQAAPSVGGGMFGGGTMAQAPTGGMFGSAQPAGSGLFGGMGQGQQAAASGGMFGGSTAAPAMGGVFGGQQAQPAGGTGLFGQTAPAQPFGAQAFGGATTAAAPTAGLSFGSTAASNNAFGGFGKPTAAPAAGMNTFGQQPQQQQLGAFGSTLGNINPSQQQPTGFGSGGFGGFGQATTGGSAFGGAQQQAQTPAFGAKPTLAFGQGQQQTTPSFGTTGFGSLNPPSQTAPTLGGFGQTATTPFGGQQQQTTSFGTNAFGTAGGFGSPSAKTSTTKPLMIDTMGSAMNGFGFSLGTQAQQQLPQQQQTQLSLQQQQQQISGFNVFPTTTPPSPSVEAKIAVLKKQAEECQKQMDSSKPAGVSIDDTVLALKVPSSTIPKPLSLRQTTRASQPHISRAYSSNVMSAISGRSDPSATAPTSTILSSDDSKLDLRNVKRLIIPALPTQRSIVDVPASAPPALLETQPPATTIAPHPSIAVETPPRGLRGPTDFNIGEQTGLTPAPISSPVVENGSVNRSVSTRTSSSLLASTSSHPPRLTNSDYRCQPDITTLSRLPDKDLARVSRFTVIHNEYGQIEWENVDVRGLDLDKIVRISHQEVEVYPGNSSPPVGTGLNNPATVTLYQVRAGKSREKKMLALQRFHESNGSRLISYDSESGVWKFEVDHFSRYKLADDDDDDDDDNVHREEVVLDNQMVTAYADNYQQQQQALVPVGTSGRVQQVPSFKPFADIKKLTLTVKGQKTRPTLGAGDGVGLKSGTYQATTATLLPLAQIKAQRNRPSASALERLPRSLNVRETLLSVAPPLTKLRPPVPTVQTTPIESDLSSLIGGKTSDATAFAAAYDEFIAKKSEPIVTEQTERYKEAYLAAEVRQPSKESPTMKLLMALKSKYISAAGAKVVHGDVYTRVIGTGLPVAKAVQKPMRNFALTMGKSFRCGWTPCGQLIHPGKLHLFNADESAATKASPHTVGRLLIDKVNPLRWVSASFTKSPLPWKPNEMHPLQLQFEEPLKAILKASHNVEVPDLGTPQWVTPSAAPENFGSYVLFLQLIRSFQNHFQGYHSTSGKSRNGTAHPDYYLLQAINLIDCAVGQEYKASDSNVPYVQPFMPLFEEQSKPIILAQRRKVMLSKWLQSVSHIIDGTLGPSHTPVHQIFMLLTCHEINKAIRIAENNGLFRLATLLSQLSGDTTIVHLLRNQLLLWKDIGADQVFPPEMLQLYRLIAGDPLPQEPWDSSILNGLGWLRAVAVLYWYCEDSNITPVDGYGLMASALATYRRAWDAGAVDEPLFPFVKDVDTLSALPQHPVSGVFRLMEVLFSPMTDNVVEGEFYEVRRQQVIAEALQPQGHTCDLLDYRSSYLLLNLLESLEIVERQSTISYIVRQSIISQLLLSGQWTWAVFVAMQIPDRLNRDTTVRNIVIRYAAVFRCTDDVEDPNWENDPRDGIDVSDQAYVASTLFVPDQWIHEGTAYYLGYTHKYNGQVKYLRLAGDIAGAKDVIFKNIAPRAILSEGGKSQLLVLLASVYSADNNSPTTEHSVTTGADCDLLTQFLQLQEAIRHQAHQLTDDYFWQTVVPLLSKLTIAFKRDTAGYDGRIATQSDLLRNNLMYDMGTYLFDLLPTEVAKSLSFDGAPIKHPRLVAI